MDVFQNPKADEEEVLVKVHYKGYSSRFDELIPDAGRGPGVRIRR